MIQDEDRDVELERLAQRLGARAAERLDVERTAAAVVARLRAERARQRPWWSQPAWLRAAAVIVLMAGVGLVVRARLMTHPAPAGYFVREDLQDLSADQLREILGSLDETLNDATIQPASDDFGDLTTEQLQALLQSLEG
jgi:hypothetical protein